MSEMSSLLGTYSNYKDMALPYSNVALVIIFIMTVMSYFYFNRIKKYKSTVDIMKLVNDFHPEPLCSKLDKKNNSCMIIDRPFKWNSSSVVQDKVDTNIQFNQGKCLNMACTNYLNLLGNENIESKSMNVIEKYGVGSCGPRGFYGTVDVHLSLESRIADFMNMEECIVYSYGFSTVASTIPAYCKSFDVIFCDSKISEAAKSGLLASRSKCIYFNHNDAKDLENKIQYFMKNNKKMNPKQRRFLFLEGIYGTTGTICDFPSMVKLRKRYQMRLFLDETNSLGVLGKTGRGILEHYNIDSTEVDLIIGSLETVAASIGGFCVGSHFTIEHQRLSGLGYCFSASLPPVLTYAAISAFDYMDNNSRTLFKDLHNQCEQVHIVLNRSLAYMLVYGDVQSPIKLIEFKPEYNVTMEDYVTFTEECQNQGLVVSLCPYSVSQNEKIKCSLKLYVNVALTNEDILFAVKVLSSASCKVIQLQSNFN